MRKMRNQKGFTIMELMIVIIVIGILIAIAVPAYTNFRARAQAAACLANVRTVQTAVGIYIADTGADPTALTDLTGGTEPYIDAIPACTTTGALQLVGGVVSCTVHGN